jgi:hypothetical protein
MIIAAELFGWNMINMDHEIQISLYTYELLINVAMKTGNVVAAFSLSGGQPVQ